MVKQKWVMQGLKKELKGFWVASINFTRHPTNRISWDFMRFLSYAGVRGACGLALLLVQYYLVVGGFYVKLLFYNLGIPKGSLSKDEIYPRWPHLIVHDGVSLIFLADLTTIDLKWRKHALIDLSNDLGIELQNYDRSQNRNAHEIESLVNDLKWPGIIQFCNEAQKQWFRWWSFWWKEALFMKKFFKGEEGSI